MSILLAFGVYYLESFGIVLSSCLKTLTARKLFFSLCCLLVLPCKKKSRKLFFLSISSCPKTLTPRKMFFFFALSSCPNTLPSVCSCDFLGSVYIYFHSVKFKHTLNSCVRAFRKSFRWHQNAFRKNHLGTSKPFFKNGLWYRCSASKKSSYCIHQKDFPYNNNTKSALSFKPKQDLSLIPGTFLCTLVHWVPSSS